MDPNHILITGGAGFVGSRLALRFREARPDCRITALDNLSRRGSELNLPELRAHGVDFVHGDIRVPEDLADLDDFELLIECSAEPSVHAGQGGSPVGLLQKNLVGAMHCFEAARMRKAAVLFLSTSRVYPISALRGITLREEATRLEAAAEQPFAGCSERGISEQFPIEGARSFYGMSKLSGESMLEEYCFGYGVPALVNRCGVLAGPGQMGKVDQGFVTLWAARHLFESPLKYMGFGGKGKQVRDVLHVDDLFELVQLQLTRDEIWDGRHYNVGGGREYSTSLCELTEICRELTGKSVPIAEHPETAAVDIPYYVSDCSRLQRELGWSPTRSVRRTTEDILEWIGAHREALRPILGS